jgi:hypothetical protein
MNGEHINRVLLRRAGVDEVVLSPSNDLLGSCGSIQGHSLFNLSLIQ